jgi:hypothetical protein
MAKSDLLKQAIADAKVVKETALANAKIALQEAFAPQFQRMFAEKLDAELMDEEDDDMAAGADEMGAGAEGEADDMGGEEEMAGAGEMGGMPSSVNVGLDFDNDGEWDLQGTLDDEELPADEGDEEAPASDEEMAAEYNEGMDDEHQMGLEEIIAELESDLDDETPTDEEPMPVRESNGKLRSSGIGKKSRKLTETEEYMDNMDEFADAPEDDLDPEISEIIEAILREEDEAEADTMKPDSMSEAEKDEVIEEMADELDAKEEALEEAYRTVKHLQGVINEVNLLNAKLLYTNKLFRNFELSESQKMKVIENFDRAGNTREAKLVFATLAESFKRPAKKRVVKESYASKATRTTAPSKQTTQILSEGFEMANRWKKLAGLL